ncbi:hypothetical protein [Mycobacterium sp.]|uniref:hypothetical protein n=1 Tax=Mycobacterium sp. TaxID=1785 RepID=UPI003BB01F0E
METAQRALIGEAIETLDGADADLLKLTEIEQRLVALTAQVGTLLAGFGASIAEGQAQLMAATLKMQEAQMSFNLQYLQLQNQMQNDNRQFTMVSNIMKTKHDTVKNTISNIH